MTLFDPMPIRPMPRARLARRLLPVLAAAATLAACASSGHAGVGMAGGEASAAAAMAADTLLTPARLAGTWRYALDTPGGGSGGYYVFRASGDSLTGEVRRALPGEPGGEAPPRAVREIRFAGAGVTFVYDAGSYGALAVSLRRPSARSGAAASPDSLTGRLFVGDSDLPLTVVRVR